MKTMQEIILSTFVVFFIITYAQPRSFGSDPKQEDSEVKKTTLRIIPTSLLLNRATVGMEFCLSKRINFITDFGYSFNVMKRTDKLKLSPGKLNGMIALEAKYNLDNKGFYVSQQVQFYQNTYDASYKICDEWKWIYPGGGMSLVSFDPYAYCTNYVEKHYQIRVKMKVAFYLV